MQEYGAARKKKSFEIFDEIASTYDLLNHTLSAGIDKNWRNKLILQLPQGDQLEVLDLATGTADTAILLGKQTNVKHIIASDLSQGMLKVGRQKVLKCKLEHKIELKCADGVKLDFNDNTFDCVTITFGIRNFYDPQASLLEVYRVLKPTGRLLIIELGQPKNKLINLGYNLYFKNILPFIGNIISRHDDAYTYLNKTVNEFPYGDKFLDLMSSAKFKKLSAKELTFGVSYLYSGDKCQ